MYSMKEMTEVETPFQRGTLSNEKLIEFYKALVYPRLIEEKMLNLLRQGKISKWFFNHVSSGGVNIIKPELIGSKKEDDSPVILDNIMSDTNMELSKESFGLYIPSAELIQRRQYGWFVRMSPSQVLESNTQIAKYLLAMN